MLLSFLHPYANNNPYVSLIDNNQDLIMMMMMMGIPERMRSKFMSTAGSGLTLPGEKIFGTSN